MSPLLHRTPEPVQRVNPAEKASWPPAHSRDFTSFVFGLMHGHPGLLGSIGYLLLTAVGISYEFLYYILFHIPILNLSEPGDFLLAGFQEPILLLSVILSVLVLRRLIAKDRAWRLRSSHYRSAAEKMERKWFFSSWVLYPLFIFVYFFSITALYAKFTVQRVKAGVGRNVVVQLTVSGDRGAGDDFSSDELLLGTNSKFVFLYSPGSGEAQIVPVASISRIVMGPPARRARH